jgi:hypothetical protein
MQYLTPYYYTYRTRIRALPRGLIFDYLALVYSLLRDHAPGVIITLLYAGLSVSLILQYTIAFVYFNALYEMGYLCNDSLTVHHQTHPTLRSIHGYDWRIGMMVKMVIVLASGGALLSFHLNQWYFIIANVGFVVIALLHNTYFCDRRERLYTFGLLQVIKYTFIPFCLGGFITASLVLMVVLPTISHSYEKYKAKIAIK